MENYNIYMNPQGDYKAVKSGWSWTAFLFTGIWALSNKLWKIGGFVLLGWVAWYYNAVDIIADGRFYKSNIFYLLDGFWSNYDKRQMLIKMIFFLYLPGLILSIYFGKLGNKWLDKNLLARGYDNIATAEASTPEGAIASYLKENKNVS